MFQLSSLSTAFLEEKKSKFYAFLLPYGQFEQQMKQLREDHPKGRHFVYAYRHLNEFNQIVENSSDDGEPKGTSGKPALMVLQGNQIINAAVIIVRYFGGIKLGTGGLSRAYGGVTNLAVQTSNLFPYEARINMHVELPYAELSKLEHQLKEHKIEVIHKEFKENVTITLELAKSQKPTLLSFLSFEMKLLHVD